MLSRVRTLVNGGGETHANEQHLYSEHIERRCVPSARGDSYSAHFHKALAKMVMNVEALQ